MNKIRNIVLLCLLLCSVTVNAQTYEQVLRNNLWNTSQNIAGLRQDSLSRSYAELFGKYEDGDFRDTWQASKGWSAGAKTASIRHLEKISLKGSFSFTQNEGYDMCGSMFINPGYYPVDVLEFTPGRKTLQSYTFDGGLAYDLTETWRIGAMMDFESANMSKRKDLRHTNWLLDMKVAPGVMCRCSDWALGINYIFRKTSETMEAEQVGVSESSYYAFLDKGLMYGVYNIWTGSGLHLNEAGVKGLPVQEFSNGFAVQAQYKDAFVEAEYLYSSGTIGEKEYIWFLFPGNSAALRFGYKYSSGKACHFARLDMSWSGRTMDETVLEKVTEGGVSAVVNQGSNKILTQKSWSIRPEYEYIGDMVEVLAKAEVGLREAAASQMYPYMNWRSLVNYGADARVKCYLGQFELTAKAGYAAGKVVEESWLVSEQAGVQTTPFRLQDYYDRQMEYATAARLNAGLALRWNFWEGLYVQADGCLTHAFSLRYIVAHNRVVASFRFGYNF